MEQPPGYIDSVHFAMVFKLHKVLYGLKQAPRAWYTHLMTALVDLGFPCSIDDSSLFIYSAGDKLVDFLVYVDDIIITGNDQGVMDVVISKLQVPFATKKLDTLHYFLGIESQIVNGCLLLSQFKYIYDLLHRHSMVDSKPSDTPIASFLT